MTKVINSMLIVLTALSVAGGCRQRGQPAVTAAAPPVTSDVVVTEPETGKGVFTPLYLECGAPRPYALENGRSAFRARVASAAFMRGGTKDDVLTAPATRRKCLFWWLEVGYETSGEKHDVFVGDAGVPVLVDVGDRYVKVDAACCRHAGPPSFEKVFVAGEEPETGGLVPPHTFPHTVWREWIIEKDVETNISVEAVAPSSSAGDHLVFTFECP